MVIRPGVGAEERDSIAVEHKEGSEQKGGTMSLISWLDGRFGNSGRVEAAMENAARAFSNTADALTRASLMKEDIGWYDPARHSSDLVPLGVIKEHAVRSRRLATYNPIVKRGVNVRSAYMWSTLPEPRKLSKKVKQRLDGILLGYDARARDEAAFNTDGMVIYRIAPGGQIAPVPITRVQGIARADNATSEADIHALLIGPVPLEDPTTVTVPDPEWVILDGRPRIDVIDQGGYKTNKTDTLVCAFVNRLTGEQWGKPDLMGAVYWAKAYKEYLEAGHTLAIALARIAFKVKSTTAAQQQAVITKMSSLQDAGATASLGADQDLLAVSKAGAGIDMTSGSPLAAMVAAALDVPLSVLLTDGSAGGRQGAETALEEPTFKAFELRRRIHQDLVKRVLAAAGYKTEVDLAPLSNDLIQRWGQVVTLGLQNGILHRVEARELFLRRFAPVNAKPVNELPDWEDLSAPQPQMNMGGEEDQGKDDGNTGVGPLSDGTNSSRDGEGATTNA